MRRTGPVMRAAAVAAVAVSSLLSASLLGLLRTVSAHLGECAISTDKAFDYQVSGNVRSIPYSVGASASCIDVFVVFIVLCQCHDQICMFHVSCQFYCCS